MMMMHIYSVKHNQDKWTNVLGIVKGVSFCRNSTRRSSIYIFVCVSFSKILIEARYIYHIHHVFKQTFKTKNSYYLNFLRHFMMKTSGFNHQGILCKFRYCYQNIIQETATQDMEIYTRLFMSIRQAMKVVSIKLIGL